MVLLGMKKILLLLLIGYCSFVKGQTHADLKNAYTSDNHKEVIKLSTVLLSKNPQDTLALFCRAVASSSLVKEENPTDTIYYNSQLRAYNDLSNATKAGMKDNKHQRAVVTHDLARACFYSRKFEISKSYYAEASKLFKELALIEKDTVKRNNLNDLASQCAGKAGIKTD